MQLLCNPKSSHRTLPHHFTYYSMCYKIYVLQSSLLLRGDDSALLSVIISLDQSVKIAPFYRERHHYEIF